jgi:CO/xanthine dehydrogenase Mo-binding subunit
VFSGEQPVGGPSFSSRAFEIIPRLLVQTCHSLSQKRLRQALPVTVRSVYRRSKGPAWDAELFTGQPFLTLSWCAAVAEVQVIPHRAEVEITRLTLVVDAGPRVDEAAARNALVEGVQMAVGWALTEVFSWDKVGKDTGSARYRLPGPKELPPIEMRFLDSPRDTRPRGLGNLGAHAVAPALLNAIRQALGPSLNSIPVSRKMIDAALRQHERGAL